MEESVLPPSTELDYAHAGKGKRNAGVPKRRIGPAVGLGP